MSHLPKILIIDDEPDDQRAVFRHYPNGEAFFVVLIPKKLTKTC